MWFSNCCSAHRECVINCQPSAESFEGSLKSIKTAIFSIHFHWGARILIRPSHSIKSQLFNGQGF
jgi:hypothetical protein